MVEKNYYAARKGILKPVPMDFPMLRKIFLYTFNEFQKNFLLREAAGYSCVDVGEIHGLWGSDTNAHIYLKLKMDKIWPIPECIETYDEPTLFTVIEFLYDYVSEPQEKYYHKWNDCGWHTSNYDKTKGRAIYLSKINDILKDYSRGFQLSSDGEIIEIAPNGLEPIFHETVQTDDPNNFDMRIRTAISKYRRYGATIDDKKDSIRTFADILEFLRKEDIKLPSKDDDDLFKIINGFDIRHHNKSQQSGYDRDVWYDWMFYTFLASINILLKLREDKRKSVAVKEKAPFVVEVFAPKS